ncbi:MAG: hypothetical protein NVSMB39_6360 [Candidatus Saccharimonadales bacterium]
MFFQKHHQKWEGEMIMLLPTRAEPQDIINICYRQFVRPMDLRRLPGVQLDLFAFVHTMPQYMGLRERFGYALLERYANRYLPGGGAVTIGCQLSSLNMSWRGQRLPRLALVGSDTMGIGSGGGFIMLNAPDFHPVISHMIYNNLAFSDDELFGQKAIRIDLDNGPYDIRAGQFKVFISMVGAWESSEMLSRF